MGGLQWASDDPLISRVPFRFIGAGCESPPAGGDSAGRPMSAFGESASTIPRDGANVPTRGVHEGQKVRILSKPAKRTRFGG